VDDFDQFNLNALLHCKFATSDMLATDEMFFSTHCKLNKVPDQWESLTHACSWRLGLHCIIENLAWGTYQISDDYFGILCSHVPRVQLRV
jgi:hypothetical protein